jgi:hypothetical protein
MIPNTRLPIYCTTCMFLHLHLPACIVLFMPLLIYPIFSHKTEASDGEEGAHKVELSL